MIRSPHRTFERRGAAIIFAVAVLSALMVFMLTTTKYLTSTRRIAENRFNRVQAEWLDRAGIELAVARIIADAGADQNEPMLLIPDSQIQLKITRDTQSADNYRIVSDARFGLSRPETARCVLTRMVRRS